MVITRASTPFPGFNPTTSYGRGVLPDHRIHQLIESGQLSADKALESNQIQPSSVDLRLGSTAYQVRASFLPGKRTVLQAAQELEVQRLDLTTPQVLQKGGVYIIPLQERLKLRRSLRGKANPKSTTGRLDVFARLITDQADQFDIVAPGYAGDLFVEVAPKTFSIRVCQGTRLNQLRFVKGASHADRSRKAAEAGEALAYREDGEPVKLEDRVLRGLWLTVDLKPPDAGQVVGWRAQQNAPVVDFDTIGFYDPAQFWEPVRPTDSQIILQPGEFYLLGSKERVRIPPDFAAEMVPYDPAMGEFRVHYAGFFDPGFGYGSGQILGTRAILEVRSHDVPYVLQDGQNIARLVYERLTERPDKLYGVESGSSYEHQQLGLGKQFKRPGGTHTIDSPDNLPIA